MAEHYAQRASAGLIVSEGTYPSFSGHAFVGQPGLVTPEQLEGWRRVTDAVHAAGGQIVAQVMHSGRVTHPLINGGHPVVAPSAIAIDGEAHTPAGKEPYPVPHALRDDELPDIIEEFVTGSRNAIAAGFDGVELHGANGYLLNQFLAPSANHREGPYGGSPENRARLVIETVRAVAEAIGAERTGLRISPEHNIQGILDTPRGCRGHVRLSARTDCAAWSCVRQYSARRPDRRPRAGVARKVRRSVPGELRLPDDHHRGDEALAWMASGQSDAVVVGRAIMANPDLVRRWRDDTELNELDPTTIYGRRCRRLHRLPHAGRRNLSSPARTCSVGRDARLDE